MTFQVAGCTALVTGANQGIGKGFVEVLLERGADRVYATARRPETLPALVELDPARVVPLTLDVTSAVQRDAAAAIATDVTLLINNAGISGSETPEERRFLSATTLDDARQVMETDCFAQAEMSRAFIPLILANGGGALVNILSIGALFCLPEYSSYSAAKAAASVMTQGLRAELAHQNIFVAGVYTAGVDTRMGAKNNEPKVSPVVHARQVLDSVAEGEEDIFAGVRADEIRDLIRADPKAFERLRTERFHTDPFP